MLHLSITGTRVAFAHGRGPTEHGEGEFNVLECHSVFIRRKGDVRGKTRCISRMVNNENGVRVDFDQRIHMGSKEEAFGRRLRVCGGGNGSRINDELGWKR